MKKIYWLDIYSESRFLEQYESDIGGVLPGFKEESGEAVYYNEEDADKFKKRFPEVPIIEITDTVDIIRAVLRSVQDYCGLNRYYFGNCESLEEFGKEYGFDADDIEQLPIT